MHANAATLAVEGSGSTPDSLREKQFILTLSSAINLCISSAVEASDKLGFMNPFYTEFESQLSSANKIWRENA